LLKVIFQLIMRDAPWYQYLVNAFIVIIGRLLDILSTRYVSKELKLETNKLARRIGWRGVIIMQIPIIVLGALDIYLAFFIFIWSLFLFANNIMGSWNTKQVGEEQYYEDLKLKLKQTKRWQIILSEISYLLKSAGMAFVTFDISTDISKTMQHNIDDKLPCDYAAVFENFGLSIFGWYDDNLYNDSIDAINSKYPLAKNKSELLNGQHNALKTFKMVLRK